MIRLGDIVKLITNEILDSDIIKKIIELYNKYDFNSAFKDNYKFSDLISYDEFKEYIREFTLLVMNTYLKNIGNKSDTCEFNYISGDVDFAADFTDDDDINVIQVTDKMIKHFYDNGSMEILRYMLHELNHFKVKYDIKCGEYNNDLVKIIKEHLVRLACHDPFDEIKSIKSLKGGYLFVNDDFYECNYEINSEEKYVNLKAVEDYIEIANLLSMSKLIDYNKIYKDYIKEESIKFKIDERLFSSNFFFNTNVLELDEAFDLLIQSHPEWLNYSQIAKDYYLDDNGKVIKKVEEKRKISI